MPPRRALSALALVLALAGTATAEPPEDSVVRVFATLRPPHPIRPWAKQDAIEVAGTGVVLEGGTILTNAHVVTYATSVSVQHRNGGDRHDAEVATLATGIDLATLKLEDEEFFKSAPPMPRAEGRPAANAAVAVYGFPVGGSNLAVTRGVVSRVEFAPYDEGVQGMRIQVDAAINPGNSGGPALVDGRMVGLTFGQLGEAENVGYVIPNEEIDDFLADVADGRYDGKPRVVDRFQTLQNEAIRARLGLGRGDRGIMVAKLRDEPDAPLRDFDVLTHVGGVALDNDACVDVDGLRLTFGAIVPRLAAAGPIPARVIREGKPLETVLPTFREEVSLLRSYKGSYPSFFVHGPLVFSPVYAEAVAIYGRMSPGAVLGSPMLARRFEDAAFPGEELVVVTAPMMAHGKLTKGYNEHLGFVVRDVDGVSVRNLLHLVELIRDARGEYITFRFHGPLGETMVFRREELDESTAEIMADNGVPRRGTADALAVWERRQPGPKGN